MITVLNLIQHIIEKIISILKNVCFSGKDRQLCHIIHVMRVRKMLINFYWIICCIQLTVVCSSLVQFSVFQLTHSVPVCTINA